jgi:hypothetical protein
MIAKCVLFPQFNLFSWTTIQEIAALYDICIYLCRDPRDQLISNYIYSFCGLHRGKISKKEWRHRAEPVLQKMILKETKPHMISMFSDIGTSKYQVDKHFFNTWMNVYEKIYHNDSMVTSLTTNTNWKIIKYEDIVDNSFDKIYKETGLLLRKERQVDQKHLRVVRTKKYGNWRKWFTAKDVIFLKKYMCNYLKLMGYNYNDWKLQSVPKLSSDEGSIYLGKIIDL